MASKNPTLDLITGAPRAAARSAPSADEAAAPLAPGALTPTQVMQRARANVEHLGRHGDLLVEGEVSGARTIKGGHITFDLKDARTALPCIIFYNDTRRLPFEVKHGLKVIAFGKPTVTDWANVQLKVTRLEPVGEGKLDLAFRQLKEKLEKEGLFAPEKKRPLPRLPRTVGVVTSSTGAAIRDVLKVLFQRMPGLHVVVAPTKVQGDGAAADIAEAIRDLDASGRCDVLLVVRGGGSLEDLFAFNTEPVARAIANAQTPVVSGVGHETDTTIADLVADCRAATPSHAAELVVPRREDLVRQLGNVEKHLLSLVRQRLHDARVRLERQQRRLADPRHIVAKRRRGVDDLAARLERALLRKREQEQRRLKLLDERLKKLSPARQVAERRAKLAGLAARLDPALRARREKSGRLLEVLVARLSSISPLTVLARGYAIARRVDDGHVLRDPADAPPGTKIEVKIEKGSVKATVDEERPE